MLCGDDMLDALHARLVDEVGTCSSSGRGSANDTSSGRIHGNGSAISDGSGRERGGTGTSAGSVTVLVDSLSSLSAYQSSTRTWLAFLHHLTALGRHAPQVWTLCACDSDALYLMTVFLKARATLRTLRARVHVHVMPFTC